MGIMIERDCVWSADDDGIYHTYCNNRFEITVGTPDESGMRYCCYCGRAIALIVPLEVYGGDE